MEVFQTNLLLDKVVVLGCQVGYKVLDGNTGIRFPLSFQLFKLFVSRADIESVENSPIQVEAYVDSLIVDTLVFGYFSGFTCFAFNIVQIPYITGREVQSR